MNNLLRKSFTFIIVFQFLFYSLDVCAQELQSDGKKKLKTASKLIKKGNFNAANDIYTQLLTEYSNNDNVLWAAAENSERINDFSTALANYTSLVMIYETQIEDLMFSSGKKDKKLKSVITKKKQKAKNKIRSCESKIKEGAQRNSMLSDTDKKDRLEKEQNNFRSTALGTEVISNSSKQSSSTNENELNKNTNNEILYKPIDSQNNSKENQSYEEEGIDISDVDFSKIPPLRVPDKGVLTNFIGLQTRGKHDQIEEIQRYIDLYFDQLKKQGRHTSNDYHDIINLSHNWVKKNTLMQYGWFEDLKTKEGIYRSIVDEYNTHARDRKRLENDLQIQLGDSLGIAQKIRINKDDSLRLHEIYDNALTEELKSKLSTIPNSIVLCGRIKQDAETQEHTKLLMNAMTDIAIKKVNAYNILSYRYSENDKLEELYELTTEGIAQTADKYYKNLRVTKLLDNDAILYDYEIYRIEVFPFNEKAKKSSRAMNSPENSNSNFLSTDLNIYNIKVKGNTLEFNELINKNGLVVPGSITNTESHEFGPDVLKFVNMISNSSEEFNTQYNIKIKEAIGQYESERNIYKDKITKIGRANKQLYNDQFLNHLKTDSIREQLLTLSSEHEDLMKEDYKDTKQDYVAHYQNKYQSINQLEVINAEQISTGGFERGFQNLVTDCYVAIKENISKKYSKTTIFKEVQFGTENMGLEAFETNYKPIIDSFQILSMNIYSIHGENFLALNLAFKIKWMMEGVSASKSQNLMPITDSEILIDDKLEEQEIENESSHSNSTEPNKTPEAIIKSNTINWKLYSNDLISLTIYQKDINSTKWRLPDYEELMKIMDNEENQMKIIQNLKPIIDDYGLSAISFISSNTSYDNDNLEINLGVQIDLETSACSKKEISSGNSIFIVQVKK